MGHIPNEDKNVTLTKDRELGNTVLQIDGAAVGSWHGTTFTPSMVNAAVQRAYECGMKQGTLLENQRILKKLRKRL